MNFMDSSEWLTWFFIIMTSELVAEAIISIVRYSYYNYRVNEEKLKRKKKPRRKKKKTSKLKLVDKEAS